MDVEVNFSRAYEGKLKQVLSIRLLSHMEWRIKSIRHLLSFLPIKHEFVGIYKTH